MSKRRAEKQSDRRDREKTRVDGITRMLVTEEAGEWSELPLGCRPILAWDWKIRRGFIVFLPGGFRFRRWFAYQRFERREILILALAKNKWIF